MRIIILLAIACATPAFAQPQEEAARLLAVSDELKQQAQILYDIATDGGHVEGSEPWSCEDYEAAGKAPAEGCIREDRWALCFGPTETIADDDPGLELFLSKYPDSLEDRKVALARTRASSCD